MKVAVVRFADAEFGKKVAASLEHTGFAVIEGAPLSVRALEIAYLEWQEFFQSKTKELYLHRDSQVGYFPMKAEHAKDSDVPDLKEFFHYYPVTDTRLPDDMTGATELIALELKALGENVMHHLGFELQQDLLSMVQDSENHLLRVLHYPPVEKDDIGERSAPHEDINMLTLLPVATAPGLQVRDNQGNWHDVPSVPGTVIINVGDSLQEASGGRFRSTTHRVVNPSGEAARDSRYSLPFFLHAHPEVRLSPRYTAGQYLAQRLREIGIQQ